MIPPNRLLSNEKLKSQGPWGGDRKKCNRRRNKMKQVSQKILNNLAVQPETWWQDSQVKDKKITSKHTKDLTTQKENKWKRKYNQILF